MRPSLLTGKPDNHFDHVVMIRRFQEFSGTSRNKPYRRKKSALKRQLSDFLSSVSPSNCVPYCTSDVIITFLISRDKLSRTVVHTKQRQVKQNCTSYSIELTCLLLLPHVFGCLVAGNALDHFQQHWPFARFSLTSRHTPALKSIVSLFGRNRPLGNIILYVPRQFSCFSRSLLS